MTTTDDRANACPNWCQSWNHTFDEHSTATVRVPATAGARPEAYVVAVWGYCSPHDGDTEPHVVLEVRGGTGDERDVYLRLDEAPALVKAVNDRLALVEG